MTDILADIMRAAPLPPPVTFQSSNHCTMVVEDWSEVRSHGRAARRRRQGHRQRIRYVTVADPKLYKLPGNVIVAHPETISATMVEINRRMGNERDVLNGRNPS